MSHELDEDNTKLFSRSPYTFRKISGIKNYTSGHKKPLKIVSKLI